MLDVEAFKRIVETAAFHQLIGLKLERADVEAGIAVLRQPYNPRLSIFPEAGVYHGGVIASLIDVAGAVACGLQVGRPTPTANFRVDFLKSPAKIDLLATGKVVRAGKSVSVADVEITDDKGEVYAVGRGTFSMSAVFKAIEGGGEHAKR
ncbi:PaaI family thioesterase [Methylocella sp. CPCC 101449]|uniref:PaaI family thioesterase n=1 Tax=Methylocella sp. CPCC 101449 TaxID=2987531 RepID=UPI0028923DBA|nr:PaaI family thioesterase [Methylocella sp. CPCC 101449]MDT2019545.1 PaaI family thioesterase [Methylocella sp. CPCC 101449]